MSKIKLLTTTIFMSIFLIKTSVYATKNSRTTSTIIVDSQYNNDDESYVNDESSINNDESSKEKKSDKISDINNDISLNNSIITTENYSKNNDMDDKSSKEKKSDIYNKNEYSKNSDISLSNSIITTENYSKNKSKKDDNINDESSINNENSTIIVDSQYNNNNTSKEKESDINNKNEHSKNNDISLNNSIIDTDANTKYNNQTTSNNLDKKSESNKNSNLNQNKNNINNKQNIQSINPKKNQKDESSNDIDNNSFSRNCDDNTNYSTTKVDNTEPENSRNNELSKLTEKEKEYISKNEKFIKRIKTLNNTIESCQKYFHDILKFSPKLDDLNNNLYNQMINQKKSSHINESTKKINIDQIKNQYTKDNTLSSNTLGGYIKYLDDEIKNLLNNEQMCKKVEEDRYNKDIKIPKDFDQILINLYNTSKKDTPLEFVKKLIAFIKLKYNYDEEKRAFNNKSSKEKYINSINCYIDAFKKLNDKINNYQIDDTLIYLFLHVNDSKSLRKILSNNQNIPEQMKKFKNINIKEINNLIKEFQEIKNNIKYIEFNLKQENTDENLIKSDDYTNLANGIQKTEEKIQNFYLLYLYGILKELNKINEGDPSVKNDNGMEKYLDNEGYFLFDNNINKEEKQKNDINKIKELIAIKQNVDDYFSLFNICEKFIEPLNNLSLKNIVKDIEFQKEEIDGVICNCLDEINKCINDENENGNSAYSKHKQYLKENKNLCELINLYEEKQKLYDRYKKIYKTLINNDDVEVKQQKLKKINKSIEKTKNIEYKNSDNDDFKKSLIDKINEYKNYINKRSTNKIDFLKQSKIGDVDNNLTLEVDYSKFSEYVMPQDLLEYIKTNILNDKIPKKIYFAHYHTRKNISSNRTEYSKKYVNYYYDEDKNDYVETENDVIKVPSIPEEIKSVNYKKIFNFIKEEEKK